MIYASASQKASFQSASLQTALVIWAMTRSRTSSEAGESFVLGRNGGAIFIQPVQIRFEKRLGSIQSWMPQLTFDLPNHDPRLWTGAGIGATTPNVENRTLRK
jgi:hypothetical protein